MSAESEINKRTISDAADFYWEEVNAFLEHEGNKLPGWRRNKFKLEAVNLFPNIPDAQKKFVDLGKTIHRGGTRLYRRASYSQQIEAFRILSINDLVDNAFAVHIFSGLIPNYELSGSAKHSRRGLKPYAQEFLSRFGIEEEGISDKRITLPSVRIVEETISGDLPLSPLRIKSRRETGMPIMSNSIGRRFFYTAAFFPA